MRIAKLTVLALVMTVGALQAQSGKAKLLLNKMTVGTETPAVQSSLMVYADGSYTYQQTQDGNELATNAGQLDKTELKELKKTIKKAGVIRLQKKYECDNASGNRVMYSFYTSSVAKKIQYNDACTLPKGLNEVNAYLDGLSDKE